LVASVTILVAGLLAAFFLKRPALVIGVSLFVAIIIGLYLKMSSVIIHIGKETGNEYVTGLVTIVGIAIGLIVMFDVIDMFAPAPAR